VSDSLAGLRQRYDAAIRKELDAWCAAPMRWGIDDCALAVANIDWQVTGDDSAAAWRGRYHTQRGARRILGAGGLVKALAAAARRCKWRRIKAKAAETGDRGLVLTPEGAAVVVRYGDLWVGRRDHGFTALPNSAVRVAYRIGG
jgi:hypothetical protein